MTRDRSIRKLLARLALPLLILSGCGTQPQQDALSLRAIEHRNLPPPDITLEIEGLGPCTDHPERRFSLNSEEPVIVLVHGCLASAGRFRSLAEVFAFHGQQAICYNYNDRDSLKAVGHDLRRALNSLSEAIDHQPVTLIGHSQGGLISRYALSESGTSPALVTNEQQLITLSAPFSGIAAADHCASTTARVISLGLVIPICMLISGDKWYEITHASDFMRQPGELNPGVRRHLLIKTDERESCRLRNDQGCQEDDYVFSLGEQALPSKVDDPLVHQQVVRAGHAEIVGDNRTVPDKLITLLQDAGIMHQTQAHERLSFRHRLSEIFIDRPSPLRH